MDLHTEIIFGIQNLCKKRKYRRIDPAKKVSMAFIDFTQLLSRQFSILNEAVSISVSGDCPAFTGGIAGNLISKVLF